MSTHPTLPVDLERRLDAANGRRRIRTLSDSDVIQVVTEALLRGEGHRHGGTVAGSYGYAATTVACYAHARSDGGIAVEVGVANAGRSGAHLPSSLGFNGNDLRRRNGAAVALAWADSAAPGAVLSRTAALRLCHAQIRAARDTARTQLAAMAGELVPGLEIDISDSLQAGNCLAETKRVAAWWPGATSVPARELAETVARREPQLLPYVLAAIRAASRRQIAAAS